MYSRRNLSEKEKSDKEQKFLLEFIGVYRTLPALWDINNNDYNDRKKKTQQYDILIRKYREKYPDADRSDVAKKINTLRTNFRREWTRLTNLNKTGFNMNELAEESTLYYFKEISFLKDMRTPSAICNVNQEAEEAETADADTVVKDNDKPAPPKLRKECESFDHLLLLTSKRLTKDEDNLTKTADVWASKLRIMNTYQQLCAEKFINDIIFEGLLGNLSRHSVLISKRKTPTTSTSMHSTIANVFARRRTEALNSTD